MRILSQRMGPPQRQFRSPDLPRLKHIKVIHHFIPIIAGTLYGSKGGDLKYLIA